MPPRSDDCSTAPWEAKQRKVMVTQYDAIWLFH